MVRQEKTEKPMKKIILFNFSLPYLRSNWVVPPAQAPPPLIVAPEAWTILHDTLSELPLVASTFFNILLKIP